MKGLTKKLGLGLWPNIHVRDAIRASREAEKAGFDSVWVVESSLNPGKDAISYLGALSVSTDKIRLGTGVINLFTRSVTLIASTIATLDEMSGQNNTWNRNRPFRDERVSFSEIS